MNQIIDPTKSVQVDMSKAIPFLPVMPVELLRDMLAAFASVAYKIAHPDNDEHEISVQSYRQADSLLKAREKKE